MGVTLRRPVEEKGSAFFIVIVLVLVAVVMVGAFLSGSLGKARHVNLQVAESRAFNAAESGLNALIATVWAKYLNSPPRTRVTDLEGIDGAVDPADRLEILDRPFSGGTYSAVVRKLDTSNSNYADVEIVARGENHGVVKTLTAVIRFGHKPAKVFDHAYFINNFGWLWGSGITVNGSVHSNGDFSLRSAMVNGDIYASENPELGTAGTIAGTFTNQSVSDYNSTQGDNVRPSTPTAPTEDANGNGTLDVGEDSNGNGLLDTYDFEDGYDGTAERLDAQRAVDMPYIGDLSTYRDLAAEKGSSITQGGVTIVDGVLGDDSGEDVNLVLVGTAANPIVLNGPVVVENDVVLKGVITGQGTIYAGRNVHIIGDLEYANPPSWPKPLTDITAVQTANAARDMVGLAAKGSVILGDYTDSYWQGTTDYYMEPPFTNPYIVDPTDAANGYVTGTDGDGNPTFDGDYRAYDGGVKDDGSGGTRPRRFFESSLSDAEIHSLAGPALTHVDAVIYTNHLLSGKLGAITFNGALVSRDEAMIYSSYIRINYDIRIRHGSYEFLDVYLPQEPDHRILYWREGGPTEP
jgi:hypothetical protein